MLRREMRVGPVMAAMLLAAFAAAAPQLAPVGGAIASAAPAATAVGLAILEDGGNAADAAVATALALAVVHPGAGNLGGGGFAVVRFGLKTAALDFRETAPAAARRDMYLDASGNPVPNASLIGPLAAGVPGSPSGLWELHRRFGRLPWARVVEPAVRLARKGFVVTPRLHDEITETRTLLAGFPESAAVWLPGGQVPPAGMRIRLPRLADTLAAYGQRGPEAITTGERAVAIVATSRRHGGVLTAADLAGYRPVWRQPLEFGAFGWTVASMPLPSSGGLILAQSCALLERLGWAGLPHDGVDRAHLMVEVWRRAYADRFRLGDPTTTQAGPAELLAPAWLDRRAHTIDRARATPSTQVAPWAPTAAESTQTTHLSVVDDEGNAVALTTTLNGPFGCGLLVPEVGFLLNNEMDDFATAPGRPNLYGLLQGDANAVAPGKRMLSSMAPTIAWRGETVLALGSPGGSRIPTATLQVLLDVIVDGEPLQAAVNRPRFHHQWMPDEIDAETGALSSTVAAALRARGHLVVTRAQIGEVEAVLHRSDGRTEAAADPRGPGSAGVVEPRAHAALPAVAAPGFPAGSPSPGHH